MVAVPGCCGRSNCLNTITHSEGAVNVPSDPSAWSDADHELWAEFCASHKERKDFRSCSNEQKEKN